MDLRKLPIDTINSSPVDSDDDDDFMSVTCILFSIRVCIIHKYVKCIYVTVLDTGFLAE